MANSRVERWKEVCAPNPAMLRLRLGREGYRIHQWNDRAGTVYGIRRHDADQSYWVISGELEISLGKGGGCTLKAGDRAFLIAGTWYSARVTGNEPVMYFLGEKNVEKKLKRKRGRPRKS